MIKVFQYDMDTDLTITGLNRALEMMEKDKLNSQYRLIVGTMYLHKEILEAIFTVRGKLDIPFEYSYCLDSDAWIVIRDDNAIFYSQGA